jgi:L-alanine-DL-glutamate epimerase-like enolase superfamily enzyme
VKITGVRTFFHGAAFDEHGADGCLLELETDAGLTGIAAGIATAGGDAARLVNSLLQDQDPRAVTGLWQRMCSACPQEERGGAVGDAIAMLDVALWDLKSRANGEPLWKCLGGSRPRINAIAALIDPDADDHALSEWCAGMARRYGFRSARLKAGKDSGADLRRLAVLHQALSQRIPEPALMIDAAGGWSVQEAITRMQAIEREFDITLVDDPVPPGDVAGLRRVSESIRAATCTGGSLSFPEDFLPHFRHRGVNVVQIDISRHGITGALQLADAAFGYELPVTLRAAPGNIHGHVAAAMPYVLGAEVTQPDPAAGDIFSSDARVEDGWLVAGDAPGHGMTVKREALIAAADGKRQ